MNNESYIGGVDLTPDKNEIAKRKLRELVLSNPPSSMVFDDFIDRLLAESKVEEINISYLRQWLNEKDPNKLVSNDDIKYWLNLKTNDKPKNN